MPTLIKGVVCAITFEQRNDPDAGAETIIGTWTGEIDTWGKYTIALLDALAPGPYYLFADEILAVEPCSEAEIQAEIETICEARCQAATRLLREADQLIQAVEGVARFKRASQAARASLLVQKAVVAVEDIR